MFAPSSGTRRKVRKIENKNLNAFQGDVSNYQQVEDAVKGQEVVISALGASTPFKRNFTLIKGIENIVAAMTRFHVERLVYQSFLGVKENRKRAWIPINNNRFNVVKKLHRGSRSKGRHYHEQ